MKFTDITASLGRLNLRGCIMRVPSSEVEYGKEMYEISAEGDSVLESVKGEDSGFWNFLMMISEGQLVSSTRRDVLKQHLSYSIVPDENLMPKMEAVEVPKIPNILPSEIHEEVSRPMRLVTGETEKEIIMKRSKTMKWHYHHIYRIRSKAVQSFYQDINEILFKKISPIILDVGVEKFVEAVKKLGYIKNPRSEEYRRYGRAIFDLWIPANDTVYLISSINKNGIQRTNTHLWQISKEDSKLIPDRVVAIPNLSDDDFSAYQSNILKVLKEICRLYGIGVNAT